MEAICKFLEPSIYTPIDKMKLRREKKTTFLVTINNH